MTRVSLIGVGNMGVALGRSLIAQGHELSVWNRTAAKADPVVALGATGLENVTGAVAASDLIILCLLDYPVTVATLDGAGLQEELSGKTILQFSSGSADEARHLERWVQARGGRYLDGFIKAYPREVGTDVAELHVSGDKSAFETMAETLTAMGRPRFISPDVAVGNRLNNASIALMHSTLAGFFESTAYALRQGIPLETIMSVYPTTARIVRSTVEFSAKELATPGSESPAVEAAIDVHANSLAAVLAALAADGFEHTLGRAALARLLQAGAAGRGGREIAALIGII